MEIRQDGTPCPDYVQKILGSPGALRARAEVRRTIAEQDRAWGDTLAEHRNRAAAQEYERRAAEGG